MASAAEYRNPVSRPEGEVDDAFMPLSSPAVEASESSAAWTENTSRQSPNSAIDYRGTPDTCAENTNGAFGGRAGAGLIHGAAEVIVLIVRR